MSVLHMRHRPSSLIQIVPGLPPAIDGIGDYALQLARQMRQQYSVQTSFLVCDPRWTGTAVDGFEAMRLRERRSERLLQAVERLGEISRVPLAPVLLHFSPYGYQKRGYPHWLVQAVEGLERAAPGRVHVAFHELDVHCANPLSSAFWVSPLQRSLLRRLCRLGGYKYTNTQMHRDRLEGWGSGRIAVIPNFSNLGERAEAPPATRRAREIVIFGRGDQRRWTYTHGARALEALCRHLDATRIIDIGAPIAGHTCTELYGVPVSRRGVLPAGELARVMQGALASFMYYPIPLLTKSGVHALTCASGTIPFVYDDHRPARSCPGLVEGVDYIAVQEQQPLPPVSLLETLAPAIYASYCGRSSSRAARTIVAQVVERYAVA